MDTVIYENQIKEIVSDIKQLIDVKGIPFESVVEKTGISKNKIEGIFAHDKNPSLVEFLALCAISGITFNLPSVETPKNPM